MQSKNCGLCTNVNATLYLVDYTPYYTSLVVHDAQASRDFPLANVPAKRYFTLLGHMYVADPAPRRPYPFQ